MIFCVNLTIITGVANITHKYIPGFTILFWGVQDVFAIFWAVRSGKYWRKFLSGSRKGARIMPAAQLGNVVDMVEDRQGAGAGVGVGAGATNRRRGSGTPANDLAVENV